MTVFKNGGFANANLTLAFCTSITVDHGEMMEY
jgi:hypothetical protein